MGGWGNDFVVVWSWYRTFVLMAVVVFNAPSGGWIQSCYRTCQRSHHLLPSCLFQGAPQWPHFAATPTTITSIIIITTTIREAPFWNVSFPYGHCPNGFRPPTQDSSQNCGLQFYWSDGLNSKPWLAIFGSPGFKLNCDWQFCWSLSLTAPPMISSEFREWAENRVRQGTGFVWRCHHCLRRKARQ